MSDDEREDSQSVYDFTVQDTFEKDVPLVKYKGKVLLIVNIASRCGHTKINYKELTELHDKYKDKDFEILSFPCNQFGKQMPQKDGEEMICHLDKRSANVGDVFKKIDVNGANADPLFVYLKGKLAGPKGDRITWNFNKFLVDKEGKPVARFTPTTAPNKLVPKIDELLDE